MQFGSENENVRTTQNLYDGTASWWTQCLPHGSHEIALSVGAALGRYGHVLFPKNIHEPAARLSELLLSTVGKGWADKVFYSDNGSTATEVGLKMAFRAAKQWQKISDETPVAVLGLKDSYHGDTLGSMDASSPNVYNKTSPWYAPKGVWFDVPQVICAKGMVSVQLPDSFSSAFSGSNLEVHVRVRNTEHLFSPSRNTSALADLYRDVVSEKISETHTSGVALGALLLEPLVHGAGGMIFVDPLFQRILVEQARIHKIPVVLDEVFTGFWRLGALSGAELLGIEPDIGCYSKSLSGGVVPLSVTLARSEIFDAFLSSKKVDALLHGHSFTAYPAGCAAAITAIQMLQQRFQNSGPFAFESLWQQKELEVFSTQEGVRRAYALGTLLVVELEDSAAGYESNIGDAITQRIAKQGVYIRPMGNVFYLLAHGFSEPAELRRVQSVFLNELGNALARSKSKTLKG